MTTPLLTDPRDFLLDDSGDIVITTDLQWSRGVAAVVQSCRVALRMFAGEWFLNLDAGIPYFQSILGQKAPLAIAAAQIEFRRELLAIAGVLDVLRMDVSFTGPTRDLTVQWQVSTVFGDTPPDTLALAIGTP